MAASWWSAGSWRRRSAGTWRRLSRKRSTAGAGTSGLRRTDRLSLEAQHVGHVVEARRLARDPARGPDGTAHEDLPAARAVGELDPLARPREHHGVLARDIAAAQGREADVAGAAGPGVAVAHALA